MREVCFALALLVVAIAYLHHRRATWTSDVLRAGCMAEQRGLAECTASRYRDCDRHAMRSCAAERAGNFDLALCAGECEDDVAPAVSR